MIYRLQDTEFELFIPEENSTVGICMSGGLDSTLLAALLIKYIPVENITILTFDLTNSVDVVKRILQYWNIEPKMEILPNPGLYNGQLAPIIKQKALEVDYLYTGINQNPPYADEIADGEKPHRYNLTRYENIIMPFGQLYKNHIVELCHQMGEEDNVMPLTYTCTERKDVSCGSCFACMERKWAFSMAGKTDTLVYSK